MLIPFEVVRHISRYLSTKEMLECLLVCKSWHRPMFESLFNLVTIKTCRSFRAFLYVIAHHELTPGKFVKTLELYIEDFNERPVTFTEFELLSRYCSNLNELMFSHNKYWRCMNDLDLSTIWLHLRKVPISRNRASLEVCIKLKDRLEQVAFYAQDQSILFFMTTSPHCPRLLKMDVATCHLLLTTDALKSIHVCAPLLRELSLMVCMENISDPPPPLSLVDRHMNHVQELKCLIHHPDSAWFPIIKATYYDIDKLTMIISNVTPRHAGYTARQHTKFEIVRSLIDLIKSTSIRELEMDFKFVDDISFLQAATATLLYDQCNDLGTAMPVSVKASFVVPGDFDCHHQFLAKLTRSETHEQQKRAHHQLEYRFIRESDEEDDEHNVSELDLLAYTIISPINKLVTELSLDIGIGGDFLWSSVITKKRCVCFDQVLSYFTHLESLTLSSHLYEFCGDCMQSDVKVTVSSPVKNAKHKSLIALTVKNISIDKCVYQYLFKNCVQLSTLRLIDCQIDDETTLILECLSLESDVLLEINQDPSKIAII
ncbi:uncharacterized protein ATC70_005648 [Mucor velutinosus]|uniref:F-box domain-containing protein n=1 Tax=Mucor velutinosus TaxID=708070 RepID=A0AAN7DBR0_9FUNG|nr:hypothetical protein ATC70_005648 [Mucor velutinosus]